MADSIADFKFPDHLWAGAPLWVISRDMGKSPSKRPADVLRELKHVTRFEDLAVVSKRYGLTHKVVMNLFLYDSQYTLNLVKLR